MQNVNDLCMECMKDNGGAEVCPFCGYRDDQLQLPPYLAPKTWLEDRYLVGKLIHQNGEGGTYMGWDNVLQAPVMIREFLPTTLISREGSTQVTVMRGCEGTYQDCLSSFLEMARGLARMRELSALLPVYDIFEANATAYYISEYVEHLTLRDFLTRNGGTLTWEQTRVLMMPVLGTLGSLHAADIIHRGISPDTLIVGKDGRMRLIGFCTAAERTARSDLAPELFSGYAAIEQYGFDGEQGPYTDVYGFAAVLYRTLVGNNPPEATARVTNDKLIVPSHIAESVPQHVLAALANALQILPDDRTQSVERLRDELSASPSVTVNQNTTRFGAVQNKKQKDPKQEKEKKTSAKYALIALISTVVVLSGALILVLVMVMPRTGEDASSTPTFSEMLSAESVNTVSYTVPMENVTIPTLSGMSYAEAIKQYGDNFNIEVEYKKYDSKYDRGDIMEQTPAADVNVQRPEDSTEKISIKVTISLGKGTVTIPDYSNQSYEETWMALVKLGFSPDNIIRREKFSATVDPGKVVETSPLAKTTNYSVDDEIIIYVNNRTEESSPGGSGPGTSSIPTEIIEY